MVFLLIVKSSDFDELKMNFKIIFYRERVERQKGRREGKILI